MSARLVSILFDAGLIVLVFSVVIGIACCSLSGRISEEEDGDYDE